jgi:hypothetical protein
VTLPSAPTVVAIEPGLGGAAFLNSVIQQPMSFLLAKPVFRARCTTTTGFATGGCSTPWASVDEDPYGMWGPSQTPTPLGNTIIVAQQNGWYSVSTMITLAGTGVAGQVLLPRLQVNGANPMQPTGGSLESCTSGTPITSGQPQGAPGYWECYCAAGDQIVINTYLSATSTQTWNTTAGQESRLSILWRATI